MYVATLDEDVRRQLLALGHPETVPGEDNVARRARLAALVQSLDPSTVSDLLPQHGPQHAPGDPQDPQEFYTEGPEHLAAVRREILEFSARKTALRLRSEKEKYHTTSLTKQLTLRRSEAARYKAVELNGSSVVSSRPVSKIRICPGDPAKIATGSWSGSVKLLDRELTELCQLTPHDDKVGGLAWHPHHTDVLLSSGGSDIKVHNLNSSTDCTSFTGHSARVTNAEFHPLGTYMASASFDKTWKLWDVPTHTEIYTQFGHSKELYALSFQGDGSLLATGGLDSIGLIWDLRIGRNIMVLDRHIKPIYSIAWRNNSYQLATGGGDGAIKIWDLRKSEELISVPAHKKNISDLKFHNNALVSSSYDGLIKVFNCDNWIELSSLEGHLDKVMSVDCTDDLFVSSGWDRSVKSWSIST